MSRHNTLLFIIIFQFLVIASLVTYLALEPCGTQDERPINSTAQLGPSDNLASLPEAVVMNSEDTHLATEAAPAETAISTEVEDQQEMHQRVASDLASTITEVEQKFQSEAVDQDWAYSQQQNLMDLFHTSESLRDIEVADITCLESVCKLEVADFSGEPFVDMMKIQREWIAQDWYREGARSFMKFDDVEGRHVIYFER